MNTFITSDIHFSHARICEYAGRPWDTVEEMNEGLIANWNSVVGQDDHVIVAGDVAMGKIAESLPLVSRLNGTKTLVVGNHDRCFKEPGASDTKRVAWEDKYREVGFSTIVHGTMETIINGQVVEINHFPYYGDHTGDERYAEMRPPDNGSVLLHGHLHIKDKLWGEKNNMIHIGVDAWDYRPVSFDEIAELIESR